MSENKNLTITKSPNGKMEKITSYDTLAVLHHLEEMTRKGECLGIAFVGICRDGKFVHGYTGAAIEQPTLTAGLLTWLKSDIFEDTKEKVTIL